MKKTYCNKTTENRNLPNVIPPESIIEIKRADNKTPLWKDRIGVQYRMGYYSSQDGLDCIWLVGEQGNYMGTTDRKFLTKYFKIIRLSFIDDHFGNNQNPPGPIPKKG